MRAIFQAEQGTEQQVKLMLLSYYCPTEEKKDLAVSG
jgi:hypothetical protein